MSKQSNKIKYALFVITYVLSCLSISSDRFDGYLGYSSTEYLLLKFGLVFIFVLVMTLINKNQLDKITEFSSIFLNVLLAFFLFDYFVTHISGNYSYYRMWWLSIIFMANAGLYIGISLGAKTGFQRLSKRFWLSFLPTYIISFLLVFARKPNTYFEVNTKFGNGLLSYFDYLVSHFHFNSWPLFNFVGNVVFFIPIAFLLNATFKKIKSYQIFIVGLCIPFIVEGYQYVFKCGSVDIDDIVFNISGFLLGFAALAIEKRIHKSKAL